MPLTVPDANLSTCGPAQEPDRSNHEATALYFGHRDTPLFGWLHSSGLPVHSTGLVLCNPFGNEGICAHRTIRHLAERAANAGIPTLRFDYHGTGDSGGDDLNPDRVAAWLDSVQYAANELRELTGVERICLAGIRLGAALATLACAGRTDVAGVIAIVPVVSGKAYLRELRMLARAIDSKRNVVRHGREEVLETAGFVVTAETQKALGEIDLKRLDTAPAPRVLIIDRQDLPAGEGWAQHLRNCGVRADQVSAPGYTEMMLDSHETVVPQRILDLSLEWLANLAGEHTLANAPGHRGGTHNAKLTSSPPRHRVTLPPGDSPDPITGETPMMPIEETAVRFGSPPRLFGILSAPPARHSGSTAGRKAILMLNSGAVHHVGPNRVYVPIARHLARLGHTVLRMDIAGIGDSSPRDGEPENVVYSKFALQDVREAIEYLRHECGAGEVSAVGLCSGAYHAFKAGVARLPLNGLIAINPLTFFWDEQMSLNYPEYRIAADMSRYRVNMLRTASWRKLLSGQVHLLELAQILLRRARTVATRPLLAGARLVGIRLKNDLAGELRQLADSAIDLHFVFAANDPGHELLLEQGGGAVPHMRALGKLRLKTIENADHTFTDLQARTSLASFLVEVLGRPAGLVHRGPESGP